jgi:hypothetical protein
VGDVHEIRVEGDRAWCETCDWRDVTRDYFTAWTRACLHFSDPDPEREGTRGAQSPAWGVCELCAWPDRVWPSGRPAGGTGTVEWPRPATWSWELGDLRLGRSWLLTCDEHRHLGPPEGARSLRRGPSAA